MAETADAVALRGRSPSDHLRPFTNRATHVIRRSTAELSQWAIAVEPKFRSAPGWPTDVGD